MAWLGEPDEVATVVDALAERLARSVVVNDPLMRLMYASRHFDDADPVRVRAVLQRAAAPEVIAFVLDQGVAAWSAPAMLPEAPELGLRARLCVPLRARARLVGLLMVIDTERTLTPAQLTDIDGSGQEIAALLAGRAAATDQEDAVRALLGGDASARAAAVARLPAPTGGLRAGSVEVRTSRTPAQAELALRTALAHVGTLAAVGPGARAEFVQRQQDAELAGRVATGVVRLLGGDGAVATGLGGAVDGLADAWRSARQARVALRGALLLPASAGQPSGVAVWDTLGADAVLLSLPDDALVPDLVPAGLRALEAHEAAPRLLATLRAYLDEGGSVPRTAAVLHLHRTSLHYRLRQIAEITGMDLNSGADRLILHLGLRTRDLLFSTERG
jgi:hypothetical protein